MMMDSKKQHYSLSNVCDVCGDFASDILDGEPPTCNYCKFTYNLWKDAPTVPSSSTCNGKCETNVLTNTNCLACRFKKCRAIGMGKEEEEVQIENGDSEASKSLPVAPVLCPVCHVRVAQGIKFGSSSPICDPCGQFFNSNFDKKLEPAKFCTGNCKYLPLMFCKVCVWNKCLQLGMTKRPM